MTVNGKRVSKADVPAEDVDDFSVIHVVTDVLYPLVKKNITIAQVLLNDRRFSTLASAFRNTGLLNTLEQGNLVTLTSYSLLNEFLLEINKKFNGENDYFRWTFYIVRPHK